MIHIPDTRKLSELAAALTGEGRFADAATVFEHLTVLRPGDPEARRGLAVALGGLGRTLEALQALVAAKAAHRDPAALLADIQAQSLPAIEKFNAHLAAGAVDKAEPYAAALAALAPQSPPMQAAALACNQALGRPEAVAHYAAALLALEPDNAAALDALGRPPASVEDEIAARLAGALAADDQHPLLRLRDLHDVASQILCRPLTETSLEQLQTLLAAARDLAVPVEPGTEWEAWERHYRLLLAAIDLDAVRGPTPKARREPRLDFVTAAGAPLDWDGVAAAAADQGAQAVFFAAADQTYVELYARWYALSILKYCDVPFVIIVHVIGGAGRLAQIAQAVGIDDPRLIFAGDAFDAEAVKTLVFDAPPKGLIAKPVAHFQSVRFLRLGALLRKLGRPVFVSDIDLLLQRGVADLLARCAQDDVVFNENTLSAHAGSRLTANLLLVNPTKTAKGLFDFLGGYLEGVLAGAAVTRWIDQVALILARHHLAFRWPKARIGYFDTETDINNIMYTSYQAHPFRFLSLYHGFDTSSLEGDSRVLGGPST